jgi:hypothetical protein
MAATRAGGKKKNTPIWIASSQAGRPIVSTLGKEPNNYSAGFGLMRALIEGRYRLEDPNCRYRSLERRDSLLKATELAE